jgi:hypothetical protein
MDTILKMQVALLLQWLVRFYVGDKFCPHFIQSVVFILHEPVYLPCNIYNVGATPLQQVLLIFYLLLQVIGHHSFLISIVE